MINRKRFGFNATNGLRYESPLRGKMLVWYLTKNAYGDSGIRNPIYQGMPIDEKQRGEGR
jgi:hypothetical protein